MPLSVNKLRSGQIKGTVPPKMVVAVESQDMVDVQGQDAKNMAFATAAEEGFANSGMCDLPNPGAFHKETGEYLKDEEAFDPNTPLGGYRVEFTFQQRL